jgi:hypothetical protein
MNALSFSGAYISIAIVTTVRTWQELSKSRRFALRHTI